MALIERLHADPGLRGAGARDRDRRARGDQEALRATPAAPRSCPRRRELSIEDLIVEEDVVVTVTRPATSSARRCRPIGRSGAAAAARRGAAVRDEDPVEHLFVASTHDTLLVFTSVGKVYSLKVHEVPEAVPTARGKAIVNLLPMTQDEKVAALVAIKELRPRAVPALRHATRQGQEDGARRSTRTSARTASSPSTSRKGTTSSTCA